VIESTVIVPGKCSAVLGPIAKAFQPEFVSIIVWFVPGKTPSDQEESSQLPLAEFVQLFVCAIAAAEKWKRIIPKSQ